MINKDNYRWDFIEQQPYKHHVIKQIKPADLNEIIHVKQDDVDSGRDPITKGLYVLLAITATLVFGYIGYDLMNNAGILEQISTYLNKEIPINPNKLEIDDLNNNIPTPANDIASNAGGWTIWSILSDKQTPINSINLNTTNNINAPSNTYINSDINFQRNNPLESIPETMDTNYDDIHDIRNQIVTFFSDTSNSPINNDNDIHFNDNNNITSDDTIKWASTPTIVGSISSGSVGTNESLEYAINKMN